MANGFMTLDPTKHSLLVLREHTFKLYARLVSEEPHTTPLLGPVATFLAKVDASLQKDGSLSDDTGLSGARAISADRGLNNVMRDLATVIHGGNQVDVSDSKHQDYFGGAVPVWKAQQPTLGPQLTLMEGWPDKLKQETKPAFLALVQPVADAVDLGGKRRTGVETATANRTQFDLYDRRALFAEYNGLAATTHGALVDFAEKHPELRLPSDWVHSFFMHNTRDLGPQTVEEVDAVIAKLQAELAAAGDLRKELVAAAEARAKAETDLAQAEADAKAARDREDQAKKDRAEAERKAKAAKKKAKK
jgi:hypothetical protein